jgi:hypothetical protein
VKIQVAAQFMDCSVDFDMAGQYSMGESPPIKAGQPELSPHLGTA